MEKYVIPWKECVLHCSYLHCGLVTFIPTVPTYEVINLRSMVRRDAERDIRQVDLSAFGTRWDKSPFQVEQERTDSCYRMSNIVLSLSANNQSNSLLKKIAWIFFFRYNLRLERNDQLLRGGNKVRVWVADSPSSDGVGANRTGSTHFGGITLEELPQVRLRNVCTLETTDVLKEAITMVGILGDH